MRCTRSFDEMNPGDENSPTTEERFDRRFPWLKEAEAEVVRQHLLVCGECADFVRAARAFNTDETRLPLVKTEEISGGWEELVQLLEDGESETFSLGANTNLKKGTKSVSSSVGRWILCRFRRWNWLGASVLGFCAAIVLLWGAGRELISELGEDDWLPSAESEWVTDFELHAVEPWGRRRGTNEMVEVRSGDVLILFAEEVPRDQPLILDISASGGIHYRMNGLESQGSGLINLRLPSSLVVTGHHDLTLRLSAGEHTISTYRIRVLEQKN